MASGETIARARALIAAALFGFGNSPARAEEPPAKEYWTENGDLVVPFGSVTFQIPAKYAHAPGFGYMPGSMKFYFNWPSFTPLPAPTKGDVINQRIMIVVGISERATQVARNEYSKRTGEVLEYNVKEDFTGIASGDEYAWVGDHKFRLDEHFYMKYANGVPFGSIHCGRLLHCIGYFDYAKDVSFSMGFSISDMSDIPPIEEAVRRFLDSMRKQEG